MKHTILPLAVVLFVCGNSTRSLAQRDSTRLDIGWLSVDKGLTQTIHIKGEDLEKMPFVNLGDAISAWLYGAYTGPGTLAYVVDGNPVADVNSYPIFDIEEVTLVQSAVGGAAYGGTQQELVLITTRRGKEKSGIRAAGQVGPVNSNGNGSHTTTNFYHQYYLGAYRNGEKVSGGLSVDWVRDVLPLPSGEAYHVITPENLQRFRINGYLSWRPTKRDLVELRLSYAPERLAQEIDSVNGQNYDHIVECLHSHLLVPQILWSSQPVAGLMNDLSVVYVSGYVNSAFRLSDSSAGFGVFPAEDTTLAKLSHLLVREGLSYEMSVGGWQFLPALNFVYDHISEKMAEGYDVVALGNLGAPIVTDFPVGPWQQQRGDLLYLSPAVDVRLARALDVQIGTRMNLSGQRDSGSKALLPFATLGFDVLHFGHRTGGASLKFTGSYAQRSVEFLNDYALEDFSGSGTPYSLSDAFQPKTTTYSFGTFNPITGTSSSTWLVRVQRWPVFWTWQAGAAYTTADGRLQLQYAYERRNFLTPGGIAYLYSTGDGQEEILQWTSDMHHVDIRFKAAIAAHSSWEAGLNLTMLKSKSHVDFPGGAALGGLVATADSYQLPGAGDVDPAHLSYTGGLVNRLRAGNWTAGLDLLYHIGQTLPTNNGYGITWSGAKVNSVLASNVYLGYGWQVPSGHRVELFLESRGLARSKSSTLPDDRRYYTIGGKVTM